MKVSVIVRSRDEAPRLRLTLASLAAQTEGCEIVLVDDGSRDETPEVARGWRGRENFVSLRHEAPKGRSAASNAGAARANGDVLIFLDGDTLAAPDLACAHAARHRTASGLAARGETWHLRGTRPFLDPAKGLAFPDQVRKVAEMAPAERDRARIDPETIGRNFAAVRARAQPGVYPGAGPRRLYELEMEALRRHGDCPALWAAASGSNFSVRRDAFRDAGGFDPELSINEHRELALRLCLLGLRMTAVDAGASYHMIHRSGWRDPLVDRDWERRFYTLHPISEVPLLAILWASLADGGGPAGAEIQSIPMLHAAARRCDGVFGLDEVRARHVENSLRAPPAQETLLERRP